MNRRERDLRRTADAMGFQIIGRTRRGYFKLRPPNGGKAIGINAHLAIRKGELESSLGREPRGSYRL